MQNSAVEETSANICWRISRRVIFAPQRPLFFTCVFSLYRNGNIIIISTYFSKITKIGVHHSNCQRECIQAESGRSHRSSNGASQRQVDPKDTKLVNQVESTSAQLTLKGKDGGPCTCTGCPPQKGD